MPYTSEKIILPRTLDLRIKLSDSDREDIKARHKAGDPIRAIARSYVGICSRRLIQLVLFPDRSHTSNLPGHWKKYYVKEKNTLYIRKHRNYKQGLYLKGLLKGQRKIPGETTPDQNPKTK